MFAQSTQFRVKYALDRLVAIPTALVLSPVLLVIALLIRLDSPGPIFFRQKRLGLGERHFTIWKFRSMVDNADALLDPRGRVSGAERITRVGRWLRLLSLDELPQIINILKGEMSFVGPRPTLPDHLPRYTPGQRRRFKMKPGVTGLAQVSGRNTLLWSKRLELDVKYVEDYSLWLDVRILLKTIRVVLFRSGMVLDRNPDQVDDLLPAAAHSDNSHPNSDPQSGADPAKGRQ